MNVNPHFSISPDTKPRKQLAEETPVNFNVVVVIPAYNEARLIGSVVLQVRDFADFTIVVDDGSDDDTATIAEAAGAKVVRLAENGGKAAALSAGFKKALEYNPDVVVAMDGDGQHVPMELPLLIAPILRFEADIAIGSRYLDNRSKVPTHRIWGHRVFNLLTFWASGTRVTDSQSGYRAFSPRAVRYLSFNSDGFSVESEMQFIATEHDLKVLDVPITILYNEKPKRSVWRQGLRVLNGVLKMAGQYRPLLFFGGSGSVVLLGGFFWGLKVVEIFSRTQVLAAGYAMISVLLSVIGMLLISTGVILHSVRALILEFLEPEKDRVLQ
ncbi:MAG: glycosyltransferase family 2 protein [Anaerolineales bacterium]|nr:glycosyltransferase family 2 protein [Anaerolineales bacterium]